MGSGTENIAVRGRVGRSPKLLHSHARVSAHGRVARREKEKEKKGNIHCFRPWVGKLTPSGTTPITLRQGHRSFDDKQQSAPEQRYCSSVPVTGE